MGEGSPDGSVISQIGLAMAVDRLLRAGFHVAVPIVDDGYDLLAFDKRRYWRIQVKASQTQRGRNSLRIRFSCGRSRKQTYSPIHVDAFIAVHTLRNIVACVPVAATVGRPWLNWSESHRWQDMGILRTIESQRC